MTLHDLVETLLEMVADGVSRDTEVCISHEFDGVNLIENIVDAESNTIRNRDVVVLVGNGNNITIRN